MVWQVSLTDGDNKLLTPLQLHGITNQKWFLFTGITIVAQVASILNMFGRVEDNGKDTNLLPWKDSFSGAELDADSVKEKLAKTASQNSGTFDAQTQSATLKHNGVTWKYTNSGDTIKLEIENQKPNLYRAGYTGNAFASYQVGFADNGSGKIDKDKIFVSWFITFFVFSGF